MEENEELKEAVEKLNTISEDEKMQKIAELREKAIKDEKAIYAKGLDDGKKQIIEELKKKAIMDEKAIYAKGIEDGERRGIKKDKIEIVKNMLRENADIDFIVKVTKLSKEEVEKIKNSLDNINS